MPKVARLHGVADLRIVEEPAPAVADGQALVRVTAVGICGSDLHWFTHGGIGDARLDRPLVVGHEAAGVVAEGPDAGRPVAIDPARPCGRCALCAQGHVNLCTDLAFAGHGPTDGAMRELMVWPRELLHPLPDGLTAVDGAMLEPLGVALHALDLARPALGMDVCVVGCGPIGLLLVRLARVAGARTVTVLEPLEHRRAAARAVGADPVVADEAELVQAAGDVTADGFHLGFEAANHAAAVGAVIAAVRPGARVVLAGIPDDDRTSFRASAARRKGLTLVLVRRMPQVYPRAIRLVERGIVDVRSLVTATYPLERAAEAFASAAARDGLKVVVDPSAAGAVG